MDFAGINWPYLVIQLTLFALIAGLTVGAVLYLIRRTKDD